MPSAPEPSRPAFDDATLRVRRTSGADGALLRDIRLEALRDSPDAFGSTYDEAVRFDDQYWRTIAEERCYFVALDNDEVVGMSSGGLNDDYPGTYWLYGMYVTPRARGSVAASLLVDAVATWARDQGARELYLFVTASQRRANAFYEKVGFERTGEGHAMSRDPNLELVKRRLVLVE